MTAASLQRCCEVMYDAGLDATVVDAFALIGGELDEVQKQIAHIDSAMTLVATLVSEGTPVRLAWVLLVSIYFNYGSSQVQSFCTEVLLLGMLMSVQLTACCLRLCLGAG
jgi:hypothetical protein